MKPKVIVMAGYGINSEEETLYAFEQSGATGEIVHINDVIAGDKKLKDYQILVFPGGFAYGDDTGSGNAYANKMRNNLWDEVNKFVAQDKLVAGICNGCQIIANLGLIPGFKEKYGEREIGMMHNASARFECRWVDLKVTSGKCVWTRDIDIMRCPVAHGEGRFYMEDEVLKKTSGRRPNCFPLCEAGRAHLPRASSRSIRMAPSLIRRQFAIRADELLGSCLTPERNLSFYNQNDWPLVAEKMRRDGQEPPEEGEGMQISAMR